MRFPEAQVEQALADAPISLAGAMADTLCDLVDSIAALDRMEASIVAHKIELIDQARQWSEVIEASSGHDDERGWNARVRARRVLASELACALRIPERSAEALVADSQSLLTDLPLTFRALSEGTISWRHARTLVDHARSIPEKNAAEFEAEMLPHAKKLTVAKFDGKARAERERMHPESIYMRHKSAESARSIELQPDRDGMAWLNAYVPAVAAHAIYNRITDMALNQQSAAEDRTLTQLRADLFAELLLDSTLHSGRDAGIRPRVLITVPVLSLLGRSTEPATLEGYGPIDLNTARELAAGAPSFTRLLTHPETGAVLSVGRTSYSVPADLRTWLRVRDGTCRFPGCSRAARNCELDHSEDWQFGGGTNHDNLAHLCTAHHRLKHMTDWSVRHVSDGLLEWTSPTGHRYTTEPQTVLPAVVA